MVGIAGFVSNGLKNFSTSQLRNRQAGTPTDEDEKNWGVVYRVTGLKIKVGFQDSPKNIGGIVGFCGFKQGF